jgi:hypothetical protein
VIGDVVRVGCKSERLMAARAVFEAEGEGEGEGGCGCECENDSNGERR